MLQANSEKKRQKMPSLRQRMTSYLRQLSFISESRDDSTKDSSNLPSRKSESDDGCFITKYLEGRLTKSSSSDIEINHGKEPIDLPDLKLCWYETGIETITAACTGPDEGLTGVKRSRLHLSAGPDIDFIDTQDQEQELLRRNSNAKTKSFNKFRIQNSSADINANKPFFRSRKSSTASIIGGTENVQSLSSSSSSSLSSAPSSASSSAPSITAEAAACNKLVLCKKSPIESKNPTASEKATINLIVSLISTTSTAANLSTNPLESKITIIKSTVQHRDDNLNRNIPLNKKEIQSLSPIKSSTLAQVQQQAPPPTEPTPFKECCQVSNASDGITIDGDDGSMELPEPIAGVRNWKMENDHAYGLSLSLYEKNYLTSEQVGNPIADCFGLVVRGNSAAMALADGVNWGEGARLAARSAVQGCLEYIDTAIFGQMPSGMAKTTREVFISLLRSFWEAHACILEVGGALSTLTAVVVLPLATDDSHNLVNGENSSGKYVVCACNVGDSFGYVYSKDSGVREITQGSHDIHSMRDMRDALGALGPANEGNKPELGNLTLSMTVVNSGDIVFLTSDGISDNFDPVVGKFAEPFTVPDLLSSAVKSQVNESQLPPVSAPRSQPPIQQIKTKLAPKRQNKSTSAIPSTGTSKINRFSLQSSSSSTSVQSNNSKSLLNKQKTEEAAFTQQKPPIRPPRTKDSAGVHDDGGGSGGGGDVAVNNINYSKKSSILALQQTSSSSTATAILSPRITTNRPKFLRSHTVIEPRSNILTKSHAPPTKQYPKSSSGLPLVTGPQRHTLTLLRLEDLLHFGINGITRPCPSARKLCHLLVDFAKMITSARRNILEQREVYYRMVTDHSTGLRKEVELNRLQQRAVRKRVVDGKTFSSLPGKLDHASVVAFTVGSAIYNDCRGGGGSDDIINNQHKIETNQNIIYVETDF